MRASNPSKSHWKPAAPPPTFVDVVGCEKDILAVNKPVGMDTIQENGWVTGYPNLKDVVYQAYPYARFLNRIDRDTSGLVLFALTKAMRVHLASIWFGAGEAAWRRKIYLAIIEDPYWQSYTNDRSLKKDGRWEKAVTHFEVLKRVEGLALISAELTSHGRTHQIRKHLQQLGVPILGDTKYGGEPYPERSGQLLHAWINWVRLPSETVDKWVHFQSEAPEDFPIRVDGGTCIERIPVAPLTKAEQLKSWEIYHSPRLVQLSRHEGESYPEYVARRAIKQRLRDGS